MIADLITLLLDAAAEQVFRRAFLGETICADQLVAAANYQRWRQYGVVVRVEQMPAGAPVKFEKMVLS